MRLAVALPPNHRITEYAKAAEAAGYSRLWVFDSPALYGDIWISVARAAEATTSLLLGAGVTVPSLRHPMATAAALAAIAEIAPGRLTCALGTGYTARRTMGRKPMRWADVVIYYRQLRGLLDGRVVDIDGQPSQMLHAPDMAPRRPVDVPIWLAPSGPRGMAAAGEVRAPGLLLSQPSDKGPLVDEIALLAPGTVIGPGETHASPRVIEAAGPWYATMWHAIYEMAPEHVSAMPGGQAWLDAVTTLRPPTERHLAVHEGHASWLTERDRRAILAGGAGILDFGWTGTPEQIRGNADRAAAQGVTELAYSPAGPDIVGELERFAAVMAG
jgi:5,10-methylenetetrahydromethanopterin reductase